MPGSLTLERFDAQTDPHNSAAPTGEKGWKLEKFLELAEARPADPPPEPEEPVSPEAEAPDTDIAEPDISTHFAALSKCMEEIAADEGRLRAEIRREFAIAFASAARHVIPSLAVEGFAAELAKAVISLSEMSGGRQIQIALAPDMVSRLRDELLASDAELSIELVANDSLDAGRALLTWQGGGAEFDTERLAEAALEILRARIPEIARAEDETDE